MKTFLALLALSLPAVSATHVAYTHDLTNDPSASGISVEGTKGPWYLGSDYVSDSLFIRAGRTLFTTGQRDTNIRGLKGSAYFKFGVCYTKRNPEVVDSVLQYNTVLGVTLGPRVSIEFSHCSNAGASEVNRGYNFLSIRRAL